MKRPLSEIAAAVLRAEAQQAEPISPAKRALAIEGMVGAMRRERRKRVAGGAIVAALALAAAVVLVSGRLHPTERRGPVAATSAPAAIVRGAASVSREGPPSAANDGIALAPGDRLVVPPSSQATIGWPNGTQVVLTDEASCTLLAPAPATMIELAAGAIHADVAKLGAGDRFVIRTSDAEVEVRGTSFDVWRAPADASCGDGTTTRVTVREGVVAVRARGKDEVLIHANEAWPGDCVGRAAPAISVDPVAATSVVHVAPSPPKSELAAQNDLFEQALTRKRAGDAAGAVAGFDQFLARYPTSHLAQSARAERMKLLRGLDPERARAAARDYLTRYPTGFARADAELILAQ